MKKLLIGGTGLISSIAATPLLTSEPTEAIINAVVQVIIAVATLFGLFKRKKK